MPLMTLNVHEAEDAKRFVEGMGFVFDFCLEIEPGQNGDLSPLQYRLEPRDQIEAQRRLRPEALATAPFAQPSHPHDFIACSCGKERFAITPYGEMNLCVSFPIPRYNLRTGTVKDGWRVLQDTVRDAKPNDHDACPSCDLKSFCQQGRADAWLETGDMSVCLPTFKELAARWKAEAVRGPAI
jgi:radical SAM protein with 4Fe4S-binding SPASM domain